MARPSLIGRVSGTGIVAALLALLLWPVAARYEPVVWPFMALLALAALAGAVVLVLTGVDLFFRPRRGDAVNPIRVFDIIVGAGLLGFALLQIHWLGGWLP